MTLENNLIRLFDYQKFAQNKKLKSLIEEAEKEYNEASELSELSDEEVEQVWAAGDPNAAHFDGDQENDDD